MIIVNVCWCGYFDTETHKGKAKESPDLPGRCVSVNWGFLRPGSPEI